jgi:hypothetical protein
VLPLPHMTDGDTDVMVNVCALILALNNRIITV